MKNILIITGLLLASFFCTENVYAQLGFKWILSSNQNKFVGEQSISLAKYGDLYTMMGIPAGDTVILPKNTIYNPSKYLLMGIVKTDSSGNILWILVSKSSNGGADHSAVDSAGNLYVLGTYLPISNGSDTSSFYIDTFALNSYGAKMTHFLMKVSPSGKVLWVENVGIMDMPVSGIGVDSGNNVYITGNLIGKRLTIGATTLINSDTSGKTSDIFLAAYDSTGMPLWAESFGVPGEERPYSLAVGKSGNIYLTGLGSGLSFKIGGYTLTNPAEGFIAKFDKNGIYKWANQSSTGMEIFSMALDGAENIYITGDISSSTIIGLDTFGLKGLQDVITVKYDSSGNIVWARAAGGSDQNWGTGISVDGCGNVWVSGGMGIDVATGYTVYFGSDSLVDTFADPSGGVAYTSPIFIAEYTSSGQYMNGMVLYNKRWASSLLAVDDLGNFYMAGEASGSMFLGSITLPYTLGYNLFITKYKYSYDIMPCPKDTIIKSGVTLAIQVHYEIRLYPNPTADYCTIQSDVPFPVNSKAALYDLSGRLINTYSLFGANTVIPLSGIAPGMYQCRIVTGDGDIVVRKLVIMK